MNNYVTSFLMASIGNSGIPLSFAFGPGETKELYNLHFKEFKDQFGIDLSTYIKESDQGPAIEGICAEKNIVNIYCLRHFLHSLKFNEFSFAVGQILKSVSDTDCNHAKSALIEEYQNLEEEKLRKLNKVLNKIGLQLENDKIIEVNSDLWNRCSMNHRCKSFFHHNIKRSNLTCIYQVK